MNESSLFKSHFDLIPFGIYVVDILTWRIIHANQAFKERFGDHEGAICHQALHDLPRPCANCHVERLVDGQGLPNAQTIVVEQFNDVADCWFQIQRRVMHWPDGRVVTYSIIVDISELKETQNRLAEAHAQLALKNLELTRLSTTDPLTGLYNRLKTEASLSAEIDRFGRDALPFSIIMADVDFFKDINDANGHQAGDAVLVSLARLLEDTVRKTDQVGRWGGEEFLILCPGTPLSGARRLAETLRQRLGAASLPHAPGLTLSYGLAAMRPGDDARSLIARADRALYAAKGQGRDRIMEEDPA